MVVNLTLWGLIFNFVGSFTLILVTLFGKWHQKDYSKSWKERYWWMGWRPIFKVRPPNEKSRWMVKWKNHVVRYGFIPPRHLWNSIGFLLITIGFFLQLLDMLKEFLFNKLNQIRTF